MSLHISSELKLVAKIRARELRKEMTRHEKLFWEKIRNRKFLGRKFYRQYPIFIDEDGKPTFYIADFYCHEKKVVIEIDGGIHALRKEKDQLRTTFINEKGIHVIRFTNQDIEIDLDVTLCHLKSYLTNLKD